jgi:adenylate cyclase
LEREEGRKYRSMGSAIMAITFSRRLLSRRSVRSVAYAVTGVLGFLLAFFLIHLPHGPEHWSADLRTAYLSARLDTQHPRIAIIEVTEKTLEHQPYIEPIDRQLLSDLVHRVELATPKAIGLDFVFDRPTETDKDERLIEIIRDAAIPIVMGALDDATLRSDDERAFQARFLARTNRPAGHLYFDEHHSPLVISDHVIRSIETLEPEESPRASFAELLANAAKTYSHPGREYIAWLLSPKDGTETFLTLAAEHVLGRGGLAQSLPVDELLRDKIVIIGGNFSDRDRHLTPLSVVNEARYPGVFIHAQILAQLLDGRLVHAMGYPGELIFALFAAVAGFAVGRMERLEHYHLLVEVASVASMIVISIVTFACGAFIFPFVAVLLGWLAGSAAGQFSLRARE